VLTSKYRK